MARPHHYHFVYGGFKETFFGFTEPLIAACFKNDDLNFLKTSWFKTGEFMKKNSPEVELISGEDLSYTSFEIENNIYAYIITLPKPAMIPEAYFIGLIHRSPDVEAGIMGIRRYITLESSMNFFSKEKSNAARLCELFQKGRTNYGLDLTPDLETFGNALISLVKEPQKFEPLISSGM